MKKILNRLLLIVGFLILLVGCNKDEEKTYTITPTDANGNWGEVEVGDVITLNLYKDKGSFNELFESITIEITSIEETRVFFVSGYEVSFIATNREMDWFEEANFYELKAEE